MSKPTVVAARLALVSFGLVIHATHAGAAEMTLGDLRDLCTGTDAEAKAACKFYILGAFEGLSVGGSAKAQNGHYVEKSTGKEFCVPDDLPQSIMRETVMKLAERDLQAFPADASTPAISFIAATVTLNYPCPKE